MKADEIGLMLLGMASGFALAVFADKAKPWHKFIFWCVLVALGVVFIVIGAKLGE